MKPNLEPADRLPRCHPWDAVTRLEGVGPRTAEALGRLGIRTVEDLLLHFPRRYLDLSRKKLLRDVKEGETVTVSGIVVASQSRRFRSTTVTVVTLKDETGYLEAAWFNQPYIKDRLPVGAGVALSGKVEWRYGRLQMNSPLFDLLQDDEELVNTGGIVPLHPSTRGLSPGQLRRIVRRALEDVGDLPDPVPKETALRQKLLPRARAITMLHFPDSSRGYRKARLRMIFEELFLLQALMFWRRAHRKAHEQGVEHAVPDGFLEKFESLLPWPLTGDQRAAVDAVLHDMRSFVPMRRLLHGEVGSGKTAVAAAAILAAAAGGYQAALMAPTEILAEQHHTRLADMAEVMGMEAGLLLGSTPAATKQRINNRLAGGDLSIVVGTHALLEKPVKFSKLGLVVIDEQHRFGVRQRLALRQKSVNPDVLVMSATPIPRTLAQALYADLDISELHELPGGRSLSSVETVWLEEKDRAVAYEHLRSEVAAGRQGYVICPLVDESDKLAIKSVEKEADRLKGQELTGLRVGIMHGRLNSAQKSEVMKDFRNKRIDVLIATTVVEVGVDVADACVMIIEHAERFGLAQLHQLRGRVGRGRFTAKCFLFSEAGTPEARSRLQAFLENTDGFKLADADLAIRGQGDVFGTRQSGIPDLRLADIVRHGDLLKAARAEAEAVLSDDTELRAPVHAELRRKLEPFMETGIDWLEV